MEVRVHGKHMQVGQSLRDLAERKIDHASRIFGDRSVADVEFSENRNPRAGDQKYRVEVTASISGQMVRVEATALDERAALDIAADKFERTLRRLKERLIQRSRRGNNKQLNRVPDEAEEEEHVGGPQIVRAKQFAMKPMLPEEAALQMEMLGHTFFFFLNGETGTYGVLYERRDGSLGLIEPA